jgi:NitT/TauT family transport system substrate-binding protein
MIGFLPDPQEMREKRIGRVIVNSGLGRPWSQYFCCIVAAHQEFVRKHPAATKRALRAIMKATHLCAVEPERAARLVADKGYRYDYSLQTMKEISRTPGGATIMPRTPSDSMLFACTKRA